MMLLMGDFTDVEMDEVQKVVSKWPLGVRETSWETSIGIHGKVNKFSDEISTEISNFNKNWRMYSFEFNGSPWCTWHLGGNGYKAIAAHTVQMILDLISCIKSQGWEMVTAADTGSKFVKNKNQNYTADADEWYFVKYLGSFDTRDK